MEIKSIYLNHINLEDQSVDKINIRHNSQNLNDYVTSLVEEILDNPNRRIFKFKDGNTEVKTSLKNILNVDDNTESSILNNSKRLLEKEINTQVRIDRIKKKIQKGSLLHLSFTTDDNIRKIIICKVEHDEVLSELNLELIKGLNTKKKVFKAILLYFDENDNVTLNHLYDSNSSKYWWDDFLELEQEITDEQNTDRSVNEIDKALTQYKKTFYPDYLILRNSFIGFYRTRDNFNFTELMKEVFDNYNPINSEFPIKKISDKVRKLPETKNFDTQFRITREKVNKRIQHKIKLANNLYLSIDDYVVNLKSIIEPYKDSEGNKYIKILSSDGYDQIKDWIKNDTTTS